MATEEVKYTIPSDGSNDGRIVDIKLTYDSSAPNANGSYTVTDAIGTYITTDNNGNPIDTDSITGIAPAQTFGQNDNELFIVNDPTTTPIVDKDGITFSINDVADSNKSSGYVNFFDNVGVRVPTSPPTTTPVYREDGANTSSPTSISETSVCYVTGTMIRRVDGDAAVENLSIGDVVVTASGAHRPIRWLGHRTLDLRRHPRPHEAMPVRIAAHAFGPNQPARDLYVSPAHAICVNVLGEVLIPAVSLRNGTTIAQVEADEVTYWHVELDSHDIILAENLPAESYLDMGNRGFFQEARVVDLAAGPDADHSRRTHADFCRPYCASGPLAEVVRAQLAKRAEAVGWGLASALEMHLEVDGERLEPTLRA